MPKVNILVLGATGESGIAFLKEVLSHNDETHLSLLIRSANRLPEGLIQQQSGRITIVEGSLTEEDKLEEVVRGVTVVVSFLGAPMSLRYFLTRSTPTPIADSFPLIKRVMKKNGVKRLLALSTPAHSLPNEQYTWTQYLTTQILPPLVIPQGSAEMTAIANTCADPELDYTIFRVPHLNNGPADTKVYAGLYGADFGGGQELSRGSLARWVLGEIIEGRWIGGEPVLGNY